MRLATAMLGGRIVHGEVRGDHLYVAGEGDLGSYRGGEPRGEVLKLSQVTLLPPVRGLVICVLVNSPKMLGYEDHEAERARRELEHPRFAVKTPNTLVGHGSPVRSPRGGGLRPEVEIALVTSRRVRGSVDLERDVLGYTIFNDLTLSAMARDDQFYAYRRSPASGEVVRELVRGAPFVRKNWDTLGPMGPWLVTPDEFGDFRGKEMISLFRGSEVQRGSSSELIFSDKEILSYLASFMTLEKGSVVSTGSIGYLGGSRDQSEFSLPEEEGLLEARVSGIGSLANPVYIFQPRS